MIDRLRVSENRALRKISGPEKDEAKGEWRKLHNEKLCDLYSTPHIIRMIRSRRMRRVGDVECMGDRRGAYKVFLWEN